MLRFKYLLLLIPIGIAILLCPKGCERPIKSVLQVQKAKFSIDSTDKAVSIEKKRLNQDSINMVKAYNHLLSKYHNALKMAPDTCIPYLDTLEREAIIVDSTDRVTIKLQDSIINGQDSEILHYKFVVKALEDSIPKAYKRGLRKGRKQGFVAGIIIDETINVAERFVKP